MRYRCGRYWSRRFRCAAPPFRADVSSGLGTSKRPARPTDVSHLCESCRRFVQEFLRQHSLQDLVCVSEVSAGAAGQFCPFASRFSTGGEPTCRPKVIVELNLVLDDLSAAPVDQFDDFCRQRGCGMRILCVRIPLRLVSFPGSESIHLSPVRSNTLRCCSDGSGLTGPIPRNRRTKLCRVKTESRCQFALPAAAFSCNEGDPD
jgi:hypothetical protein